MTMREYEAEFNRLKRYGGHEMEEEQVQVCRFLRGVRIDFRNLCMIRNNATLSKLVEKAAMLEDDLAEEAKMVVKLVLTPTVPQGNRVCSTCKKVHSGTCRLLTEECLRCGSRDHKITDCPERERVADTRVCYNCGDPGHLRLNCLKLGQQTGKWANETLPLPPPPKRQAIISRVYSISEESIEPSTSRPINVLSILGECVGTIIMDGVETHVLFDSGASNCFVCPEMIGKADLKIYRVKAHNVILGMDCLGKYMAYLDCHRGRVLFETAKGMLVYRRIQPVSGSLIVTAIQAEQMIEKGYKAYLVSITTVEVGSDAELKDIPAVREFKDVFRALNGLPPASSDPFTIELELGTAPISKAPYRMAPAEMAELKKQLSELMEKGFV
ncbi:PREDICTED: uncharacterized protein LOC109128028 [Camelina sativa]|uniref:Uncharacterized protein LOC109128028 n=1 Tax=Camelina sativa TaxID=90675 RepID=A0ABM1QR59_CAMSA|nr:PREDICTED: uncharacterized protein LOC109128028 [Camelina sativa]